MTYGANPVTDSPTIVLGVHRSGTSVLSQILSRMGVHMGFRTNIHYEDQRFKALNKYIMGVCHGHWDWPLPCEPLFSDRELREKVAELVHLKLRGNKANRILFGRSWGWKDPRTIATLPVWTEIFPKAKIVAISRDPAAVSQSLVNREISRSNFVKSASKGIGSVRCATESGARAVLEEYDSLFRKGKSSGFWGQHLEIDYSTLLSNPVGTVVELQNFLGVELGHRETLNVAQLVRQP